MLEKLRLGLNREARTITPCGCFAEDDPSWSLLRRACVEASGTTLLTMMVFGSGLTARYTAPNMQVLGSALAISGALISLIIAFRAASGAHFNPLITIIQWLSHQRSGGCTLAYVVAQLAGAFVGAMLIAAVYGVSRVSPGAGIVSWPLFASEFIGTAGLFTIILSCARNRRPDLVPFAVGAWIVSAVAATPSRCLANPAIALAAAVAAGPGALSTTVAFSFVAAEAAGALAAFALVAIAYPMPDFDK
jgi:glycerol uptake facilitator-like aquaporin